MYKKEEIGQFKCDLKENMKEWAIGKVNKRRQIERLAVFLCLICIICLI